MPDSDIAGMLGEAAVLVWLPHDVRSIDASYTLIADPQ